MSRQGSIALSDPRFKPELHNALTCPSVVSAVAELMWPTLADDAVPSVVPALIPGAGLHLL
jgi:hypothetical protein